jgi:hypothetical protein
MDRAGKIDRPPASGVIPADLAALVALQEAEHAPARAASSLGEQDPGPATPPAPAARGRARSRGYPSKDGRSGIAPA